MNVLGKAWSWYRSRAAKLHDLVSGEDLADAQRYRSQDLPDWIVPGGSGRSKGHRSRPGGKPGADAPPPPDNP